MITVVKGLVAYVNEDSISRITTLPKGVHWSKEERQEAINAKRGFFLPNEQTNEYHNGIIRKRLPYPWDEVAYHILKYIYYEGRLCIMYF